MVKVLPETEKALLENLFKNCPVVEYPPLDMNSFRTDLEILINRYNIKNEVNMPDHILAELICYMIKAIGPSIKNTLDWNKHKTTLSN